MKRNNKIYRIVNVGFVFLIVITIYLSSVHSWDALISLWVGFLLGLITNELIRSLEQ